MLKLGIGKCHQISPAVKSNSGMPSFCALSARLSEMPGPGNTEVVPVTLACQFSQSLI